MRPQQGFSPPRERGFSLIELMTAMAIGLIVLAGLTSVFVNSSRSAQELRKTAEQIENGRYAIEVLSQDIRHAGYFGELWTFPATPLSSDPCDAPVDGAVSDTQNAFLAVPVDVHFAPDFSTAATAPTNCATNWLTAANLQPGSDIVVVRRVDTSATTSVTAGQYYLQTTAKNADLQLATTTGNMGTSRNARNVATDTTTPMTKRDTSQALVSGKFPEVAATLRKWRTHIYFVAPCSVGTDTNGRCKSTDDTIPTLKRLEMTGSSGATLFTIVPVAEGIQALRVQLGVDDTPTSMDPGTGLVGDSVVDSFVRTRTMANLSNTVAMRVYLLARNTEATSGYTDNKTYTLGSDTTTAANDAFKRHVYGAETRIINLAGRKEIPQ